MSRSTLASRLAFCLLLTGTASELFAYETDPYTNRDANITDAGAALDRQVNAALDEIADNWKHGEDEWRFVSAIYWKLGGKHWVDKLERWAIDSPNIEKLPNSRKQSVYRGLPLYTTRVAGIFGFGPTVKVYGAYMGTDKIGHFFSQGRKFYRRFLRTGSETKAAGQSIFTEKMIFGKLTTGVYSNADLVANYEGYRFYRSLFHSDVIPEKVPIYRWEDGKPVRQRAFTWADYVNVYWDEAINANSYDRWLLPRMKQRLLRFCETYRAQPSLYPNAEVDALYERYRHIGVDDTRKLSAGNFFSANCP